MTKQEYDRNVKEQQQNIIDEEVPFTKEEEEEEAMGPGTLDVATPCADYRRLSLPHLVGPRRL